MMRNRYLWPIAAVALLATACDSPLDTNPTDAIDSDEALNTPRGIELALNGAYRGLQNGDLYGNVHMVYPDLYADNLEFTGTFQTDREVALRNITTSNVQIRDTWFALYDGINRTNNLLDAIPGVSGLSAEEAEQATAESLFLRSLYYSILVSYHGGVPIITEPSRGVDESSQVPRDPADAVWDRVIADLETASGSLAYEFNPSRATGGAADALLARVYLETGDYAQARDKATAVIESGVYELNDDYASNWTQKFSEEAIFELPYSINTTNSLAFWYFPDALGGRRGFAPTQAFYDAYEAGDERRDFAIGIEGGELYGKKYFRIANSDDNVVVLRLAEMYLIRAEANARLGADAATVRADIDIVRNRAGLPDLPATVDTQQELLDAILQERRFEFAMEGHRFFDLRRFGVATDLLGISAERLLFPIPQAEIDVNDALEQNPGY
ncbi:MAG TPA: RagB/SusD family nutrient uptake outer membrane protein [Longimicrobiales bacterium]|nr:RagB/SusD family nutrient uptake outer membrane protein [Longimicrobiales bacterium]